MTHIDSLQITIDKAGPVLTPQQKRFNTLIRQIEQQRQSLAAWHENIANYRRLYGKVLLPLQTELIAANREWAFALDALTYQRGWSKADAETLRELVCDAVGELLRLKPDDAELKALYDKHSDVDFDTERKQVARAMKDMTEAVTGLDLGDDEGINSDDDLFERMQQGLREQAEAEAAEAEAREAERNSSKAQRRRKSVAQQRREDEAQLATQSVREVFRKLASALHPDREPDAKEREVKTALMQQVNQAYAANDLLTLLELQLRIEQIDAGHIASASAERLKHYNKVLSEQLAELKAEVERVEFEFRLDFGLEPGWGMNPRKIDQLIGQHSRQLQAELKQHKHEMRMLADTAATKRWLKHQRRRLQYSDYEFGSY